MLVTFTCDAYENLTYFGDVALHLLQLMGHSGTVPGAILAHEIPEALARLEKALGRGASQNSSLNNEDEDKEPEISLVNRALPLTNMLKAAVKNNCDVLWS